MYCAWYEHSIHNNPVMYTLHYTPFTWYTCTQAHRTCTWWHHICTVWQLNILLCIIYVCVTMWTSWHCLNHYLNESSTIAIWSKWAVNSEVSYSFCHSYRIMHCILHWQPDIVQPYWWADSKQCMLRPFNNIKISSNKYMWGRSQEEIPLINVFTLQSCSTWWLTCS